MANKSSNVQTPPPGNGVSMPSVAVMVGIALVGGILIGNLSSGGFGHGNEASLERIGHRDRGGEEHGEEHGEAAAGAGAGEAAPAAAGDIERIKVEVSAANPQRGPDDALVTIVEFSDFQCPFCSRVEPTIDQIVQEYGDQVRIVWRNQPLPFHEQAMPAAELAMEAKAQGGNEAFWRVHHMLFENQRELSRENLESYAQQAGLNLQRVRAALDQHTHQEAIQADQQVAQRVGANGTPAFFINGRSLVGAQPFQQFKAVIDDEIRRANAMIESGTARDQVYATLMRSAQNSPTPQQPQGQGAARPQPDPNAVYRVAVDQNDAVRGPNDALVTLVLFSEFQCPYCSRVRPTVEQIFEHYGNDVRLVFKNNPLPFHDNAMPAAEAAAEAFAQGGSEKFWQLHDLLFENQRELNRESLERFAQQIGLNMDRFRNALDNHTHQAEIEADQNLARSLGASGTPSFFINGRNLRGAQPFPAFQAVIDEELAKAREKIANGTPRARVYEATIANGATEPVMLPGAAPSEPEPREDPNRVYDISVPANAPAKGAANAPVTIQLFSDFQCPYCSRVEPTLNQVLEQYAGRVRVVWRNYPLPFHDRATPAAEAAMEVYAQGGAEKFWQYHDKLFENQRELTDENLAQWAQELGINMTRFRAAMENHTHNAAIQADMNAVRDAGAQIGTPSAFINGRLLQGAQPFPAFQQAIDRALNER